MQDKIVDGTTVVHCPKAGCKMICVTNCDTATGHVTGPHVYNHFVSLCFSLVCVMNRDTATSHVTGPYVYNSIVSLCFFFSLNINCDTPLKVIPEQLDTGD